MQRGEAEAAPKLVAGRPALPVPEPQKRSRSFADASRACRPPLRSPMAIDCEASHTEFAAVQSRPVRRQSRTERVGTRIRRRQIERPQGESSVATEREAPTAGSRSRELPGHHRVGRKRWRRSSSPQRVERTVRVEIHHGDRAGKLPTAKSPRIRNTLGHARQHRDAVELHYARRRACYRR